MVVPSAPAWIYLMVTDGVMVMPEIVLLLVSVICAPAAIAKLLAVGKLPAAIAKVIVAN